MYRKGLRSWLKHLDFLILDVVCLNLSILLSLVILHNSLTDPLSNRKNVLFVILFNIVEILVALMSRSYKNVLKRGYGKEFLSVLKLTLIMFLSVVLYYFVFERELTSALRNSLFVSMGVFLFLSFALRVLYKKVVRFRLSKSEKTSLLVVTTSNIADRVVESLIDDKLSTYVIKGVVIIDKNLKGKKFKGVPVVADAADAAEYVCREWIDEVFVDVHRDMEYPEKLIREFEVMGLVIHTRLANSTSFYENRQLVERMGEYTVLTSTINYASPWALFAKRLFDIFGGLVGTIGMCLLFPFVGLAIKIKSPGPVFFSQERVGKNGKHFKCYKFRTMYVDAEEQKKKLAEENRVKDGMMFKLDFDPRIIGQKKLPGGKIKKGLGGWLRALSIDEFPQFINILKGEMSMVGTRPPTIDEWEKYELHHRARLAIKPGLTGMWQVSGRSKITDFEEVVRLDTKYIREWSLLLDLKILLKTFIAVLKREGSM